MADPSCGPEGRCVCVTLLKMAQVATGKLALVAAGKGDMDMVRQLISHVGWIGDAIELLEKLQKANREKGEEEIGKN